MNNNLSAAPSSSKQSISSFTSYSQHRSHLLVRSVSSRDSGIYRCDSDLTGEASVQVYVVAQEDLMKSLHLHGSAVEHKHISPQKTSQNGNGGSASMKKGRTYLDNINTYSSSSHDDDDGRGNSFYHHPTKSLTSHHTDYSIKSHSKHNNKSNSHLIENIWNIPTSSSSTSSISSKKLNNILALMAWIIIATVKGYIRNKHFL